MQLGAMLRMCSLPAFSVITHSLNPQTLSTAASAFQLTIAILVMHMIMCRASNHTNMCKRLAVCASMQACAVAGSKSLLVSLRVFACQQRPKLQLPCAHDVVARNLSRVWACLCPAWKHLLGVSADVRLVTNAADCDATSALAASHLDVDSHDTIVTPPSSQDLGVHMASLVFLAGDVEPLAIA